MKTEAEIRARIADLEAVISAPCDCSEGAHRFECFMGGKMARAELTGLLWALGEHPDWDEHVTEIRRRIQEATAPERN